LQNLVDALEGITAHLVQARLVPIELPQAVVMTITETSPSIKGGSASARTKPAIMATGLVVQVPEYVEQGESIKINSTNAKFMSRA
jgi:elongation factor P